MSNTETIDLDAKLQELLKLSSKQRIELAERLIESVGGFSTAEIENAWLDEADRRHAEIQAGKDPGVPAAEAIEEARRTLDERRQTASSRPARHD